MFTRRTIISALVCALLTCAVSVAPAGASQSTQTALAQEQYYASFGTVSPSRYAAEAQGRYYASYGDPKPLTSPHQSEPSEDTPWLVIALSVAATLAIVAASATQARRLRIRRRAARVTT